MAPNDKNATVGNPIPRSHANEDQNTSSAIPQGQDQTLLEALQDLIVQVTQPMRTNNTNQTYLGPEAGKFITALQEFISSIIVHSQAGVQNTVIDVNLDEEDSEAPGNQRDKKWFPESDGSTIKNNNSGNLVALEKPKPTFEEKLLWELREQVFNKMPIRLLCFEPHGSSFQIALLERGAIFGRLVSKVQGKIHEKEFRPQRVLLPSRPSLRRRVHNNRKSQSQHQKSREKDEQGVIKLETEEEVIKRLISKYAGYAILSHTWFRTSSGEVTYGDWSKGIFNSEDPGYQKLVNFCKAAWKDHQVAFGWMDTVCINKDSSSELDESIRSMYNWYSRATVCITYLAETRTLANIHHDPWFTRGWTLQELLAPKVIKFYNSHWKQFIDYSESDNDKMGFDTEIQKEIERATSISSIELDMGIHELSISRKMQMAATREVTREEDTAYSLMGIFNVSISTAYGEGAERAFSRLLQEIMTSSEFALDILNWAGNLSQTYRSRVLPSSPKYYINRYSSDFSVHELLHITRPTEPLTLTHLGLRVPVILMPAIAIQDRTSHHDPIGDYNATVDISPIGYYFSVNAIPTIYNVLDHRITDSDGWNLLNHAEHRYQMTFAVFNFTGTRNITSLPQTCHALGLDYHEPAGEVSNARDFDIIRTEKPIVFKLNARSKRFKIPTDELPKHGMRLISLYL